MKQSKTLSTRNRMRLIIYPTILAALILGLFLAMNMPGESASGEGESANVSLESELNEYVNELSVTIGPRNLEFYNGLRLSAKYIEDAFSNMGYTVHLFPYSVPEGSLDSNWEFAGYANQEYTNIEVELRGTEFPDEIVVVGAHYDSVALAEGCPGANDNASGMAAVLAMARSLANQPMKRTVRFVAFVNEEPPFFQTEFMGSYVYAMQCKERSDNIVAMMTPETIGCFSDEPDSQSYPFPLNYFYPSTGNFIAFVGNFKSRGLVRRCIGSFREHAKLPSEGAAYPGALPGIGWSDHWSFWQADYNGIMITDTAPFRYAYYHTHEDTIDKLDFKRMTIVVEGLEKVLFSLAN